MIATAELPLLMAGCAGMVASQRLLLGRCWGCVRAGARPPPAQAAAAAAAAAVLAAPHTPAVAA